MDYLRLNVGHMRLQYVAIRGMQINAEDDTLNGTGRGVGPSSPSSLACDEGLHAASTNVRLGGVDLIRNQIQDRRDAARRGECSAPIETTELPLCPTAHLKPH